MERLQDIINVIGASLAKTIAYRPTSAIMEFLERKEKKPEEEKTIRPIEKPMPEFLSEFLRKYPLGETQREALIGLFTSPPERVKVGYKVKKKLFGKKKKPIYKEVFPGPKAIEKYLPELLTPSPEVAEKIGEKISPYIREVIERAERMTIPETAERFEKPLHLETYRGETIYDVYKRKIEELKAIRTEAGRRINEILETIISPEALKTLTFYVQMPAFIEVGELINRFSKGFYDMRAYFESLKDLSEKARGFVENINSVFSELLGVKEDLISQILTT